MSAVMRKLTSTTDNLDEILFEIPEPQRSFELEQFLSKDEPVKLRSSKGSFIARFRGETVTIPPSGRHFGRRTAVDFLYYYGRGGIYHGKDQATMMTPAYLESLSADEQDYWVNKKGVKFQDTYVYHDTENVNRDLVVSVAPDGDVDPNPEAGA
jgi:hypothetical protein